MRHLLEGEPHRVLAQHASVAHPLRRWDGHPHLPFDAFGEPFDAFGERPDGLLEDGGPVVPLRLRCRSVMAVCGGAMACCAQDTWCGAGG
jgi:hypothetical protein